MLALAAALPVAVPSMFFDSAPSAVAPPARSASTIVVTTSQPAAAGGPERAANPPPGDDRWWRNQVAQAMTTTSVVTLPKAPAALPSGAFPVAEVVRNEAALRPSQSPSLTAADIRLTSRVPAQIRRWEPLILKAARKYDVDPALIAAVMMTESSGRPDAVSSAGAIGLMQVLDGPTDPEANVDLGAKMLSAHLRRFGAIDLALAAYNAGPGNVVEHGGVPPFEETRNHIARTLASYTAWRAI
jgi:soluble lytic murein transglycosylase-like protein